LETAVRAVVLQGAPDSTVKSEEETDDNLLSEIIELYKRVKVYQRAGDWENFGRAMKEFDSAMSELEEQNDDRRFAESFVGPPEDE
jgi:hypothetical protein